MQNISYNSDELLNHISQGAFLTTSDGKKSNTMTIGWGGINHIWQQPMFLVLVRPSRYTWQLLEKSGEFTVSVPTNGQLRKELGICGSKSGRDCDKISLCQLNLIEPKLIETKLIAGCDLYYECKVVAKQEIDPNRLDTDYDEKWYPDKDYHTVYFGQIVANY